MNKLDLGAVTAYAMAVEQGYEGTEEEFAALQAESGNNAVRAETAADRAQQILDSIPLDFQEVSQGVTALTEETTNLTATQNRLNKDAVKHGYIGQVDYMNLVPMSGFYVSEYIPVQSGAKVVVNQHFGSSGYGHIVYDADSKPIASISANASNLRMTMPDGAAYIRITGEETNIDEMVVLVLDPDFKQQYANKAVADFLVEPENLFDASTVTEGYARKQASGELMAVSGMYYSEMIPVQPYQIYRIAAGYASTLIGHCWYRVRPEDGGLVYLSGITPNGEYGGDDGYKLVQAPADAEFLTISGIVADIDKQSVHAVRMQDSKRLLGIERDVALIENGENLFGGYTAGYLRNNAGTPTPTDGAYYSDLIKVEPLTYYKIDKGFQSGYFGHAFYDWDYNLIGFVNATGDNEPTGYKIVRVPEGAAWLSISGMLADVRFQTVHALRVQDTEKMTSLSAGIERLDEYARHAIKHVKWPTDGYRHQAFPSACYWNGQILIASRVGDEHLTPTDESLWGGIVFDMRSPDGYWTHKGMLTKADFDGLDGEIRDVQIMPTRDGSALVAAMWTTYYGSDGTEMHDGLLALMDKNLNVTDYLMTKNVPYLYHGYPLFTPSGHLIVTGYLNGRVVLYRANEAFAGKVSTLTFEQITLAYDGTNQPTEASVGYYNDKLVCLIRRDNVPSLMTVTSDLEGASGWSEPVSIGIELHAPKLLPYYKGNYLVFFGAYLHHYNTQYDRLRYACVGYLDVDNAKVIAHGKVDETQTDYSGYCGVVPFGGEEYGIAYYQEGAQTALYYKRVNARYLIPQLCYYI